MVNNLDEKLGIDFKVLEKGLTDILENVDLLAIAHNLEGKVVYINPYFLRLSGYDNDEILGSNLYSSLEPKLQTKSGAVVEVYWSSTSLKNDEENSVGLFSVGIDVTVRNTIQRLLEQSERTAAFALNFFDQTQGILHNWGTDERQLLWAAAILHNCGLYVSHSAHHKHSYYLIRNGELLGYTETEIEVKEIAKTMGVADKPPDVLLSVMANETEMRKTGLEKYKYIHFATHASLPGMIQGINEPFILLGQVENESKDDGFLTLSEVLDLRLNADMVVLSACVTGVGKEVEGEGVANFARAFQHAGVKSVVVSLWEVASDPAVEYMEKFYEYLKAGKSRSEAMRLARNEIKAKYPNPFYWAVFILHGEG